MAGKKRTISALVVVGNGNGVVGFGVGRGEEAFAAIRKVHSFLKIILSNVIGCCFCPGKE